MSLITSSSKRRETVIWSPHKGLCPSAVRFAPSSFWKLRVRRISEQLMLVSGYCVQPDLTQIVDRRTEPDDARDVGGSSFEFVRQRVVVGLLEGDCAYHVAAALVWRHGLKQVGLPVQNTD